MHIVPPCFLHRRVCWLSTPARGFITLLCKKETEFTALVHAQKFNMPIFYKICMWCEAWCFVGVSMRCTLAQHCIPHLPLHSTKYAAGLRHHGLPLGQRAFPNLRDVDDDLLVDIIGGYVVQGSTHPLSDHPLQGQAYQHVKTLHPLLYVVMFGCGGIHTLYTPAHTRHIIHLPLPTHTPHLYTASVSLSRKGQMMLRNFLG